MLENPEKWPKFGKCDPQNPQNENNFSLYTLIMVVNINVILAIFSTQMKSYYIFSCEGSSRFHFVCLFVCGFVSYTFLTPCKK